LLVILYNNFNFEKKEYESQPDIKTHIYNLFFSNLEGLLSKF